MSALAKLSDLFGIGNHVSRATKNFSLGFYSGESGFGTFTDSDPLLFCQTCHQRNDRIGENSQGRNIFLRVGMPLYPVIIEFRQVFKSFSTTFTAEPIQ